jgi:hypothetical protein
VAKQVSNLEKHLLNDVRLHERFLRSGVLSDKDIAAQNKLLPDSADNAEFVEVSDESALSGATLEF